MPESSRNRSFGYTLLELMVVVAIIAISATIVIPGSHSNNQNAAFDAASYELLNAIRQAQSRSESEGVYTAVRIQENTTLDVLLVDDTASPPEPLATQIIHPLTKRPYSITLSQHAATSGVSFDTTDGPFVHADSSTTEFLIFDPQGRPFVVGTSGIGLLAATNLSISMGALQRVLAIDNISGRARIVDPS